MISQTHSSVRGIIHNMDISTWLKDATKQLKDVGIESNRLDAELLLAETLRRPRTYLHAHLDEEIDPRRVDIAYARLELRKDRVPLAYLLGYKEFYGRKFIVSPQVLIPRPESEAIITTFLEVSASDISSQKTLIDVGTGSGCLGITAKLERPNMSVILSDISRTALDLASKNAEALGASVRVKEQDLLESQIEPVDYIIANLPYVDSSWPVSPELRHEPRNALFAEEGGTALIKKLVEQAARRLNDSGWILLEADPSQHDQIISHSRKFGLVHQKTNGYCIALALVVA